MCFPLVTNIFQLLGLFLHFQISVKFVLIELNCLAAVSHWNFQRQVFVSLCFRPKRGIIVFFVSTADKDTSTV